MKNTPSEAYHMVITNNINLASINIIIYSKNCFEFSAQDYYMTHVWTVTLTISKLMKKNPVVWTCSSHRHLSDKFKIPCPIYVTLFTGARWHDDVIKWNHFLRYWPFVRGIHRSLVNSPHKGQWPGAVMFSLICVWINGWVNNRETGD